MKMEGGFRGKRYFRESHSDWRELFDHRDREKFTATINSLLGKHGHSLFGEPHVPARVYFCLACKIPVLSQDVKWNGENQPHCPKCETELLEFKSPKEMKNRLESEWQKRFW